MEPMPIPADIATPISMDLIDDVEEAVVVAVIIVLLPSVSAGDLIVVLLITAASSVVVLEGSCRSAADLAMAASISCPVNPFPSKNSTLRFIDAEET
jgi:hypothetical protein